MKKFHFTSAILFTLIFINTNCKAQKDTIRHGFIDILQTPCFETEHPKVINLPDTFNLKTQNLYALFSIHCLYDSNGVVLKIKPFSLYIKNKADNKYPLH
ncbi:MAG TPA: hypothetical protein VIJ75_04960 [Hanamia sp.]